MQYPQCQKYNLKSLLKIIYTKYLVSYTVAKPWTSKEVKNKYLFQKHIPKTLKLHLP